MITLLHGNYVEASRKEFTKLKEEAKGKEIRILDGKALDPTGLTQATESRALLGEDTIVFIENLFSKLGRKTKLIESLSAILNTAPCNIILWEDKEVGATVLKNLPKAHVQLFKIPSLIFQMLDGLAPGQAARLLAVLHTLTETEAPELIFAMIVRRVRQLIQIADNVIPEGLAGWQASRLTRQAKLFTLDTLLTMYKRLLDMEYSLKNGSSPFTTTQYIEQFLLDL